VGGEVPFRDSRTKSFAQGPFSLLRERNGKRKGLRPLIDLHHEIIVESAWKKGET